MFTNKKNLLLVVAVAFVAAVAILGTFTFINRDRGSEAQTENKREVSVSITEDGFVPETVNIERGTTVIWVNDTAAPHQVGANPYPDATSLPGLKSDVIAPGESYGFTFEASGAFGYADYTKPTVGGSIQVK